LLFFVRRRTHTYYTFSLHFWHFTPFAFAMEALWPLWDVIFSGAQPRGKWLCVNDDSYGTVSLRPYFAGHVALTADIFAKLFADRRTRWVQVKGERGF